MSKRNNKKFVPPAAAEKAPRKKKPVNLAWYHIAAISLAIVTVFLAGILTTSDLFWGSGTDIHTYQYPHRLFAYNWLKEGIWPLWNPYIFGGVPFQTGVHPLNYPLTILGLIFSTGWEIKFSILIHLTLTLTFTVLFLRLFNIKIIPAFMGGICFALSGFTFSHLYAGHLDIIITTAYLPIMMYFYEKALRSKKLAHTLICGLAMALTLTSGHYQIVYMTILLMGFLTILRTLLGSNLVISPLCWRPGGSGETTWRDPESSMADNGDSIALLDFSVPWKTRWQETAHGLTRLVIIGLISGGVTLFQLWPLQESSGMANRSVVRDLEFATSFGTPKMNWFTYLAPDIFGGTADVPFLASWSSWEGQGYFGIIALLLAIIAIAILPWRKQLPLFIITIFATLLAMGKYAPFFELYFYIDPLLGRFRVPSRFVMLVAFCGSWLAAITMNYFLSASQLTLKSSRKGLNIIMWTVIALVLALQLLLLLGNSSGAAYDFVRQIMPGRALAQLGGPEQMMAFMSRQLISAVLMLIVTAITLNAAAYFPEKRKWLLLLLVVISASDFYFYARPKLTTAPATKFGFSDKLVNYISSNNKQFERIMTTPGLRGVNNGAAHGLAHDGGYDTLIDARYNEMANLAMGYDKDRQLMLMTLFNYGSFWENQGVAWLLSDMPLERFPRGLKEKFSSRFTQKNRIDGVYVYHNDHVLPRAFISHQLQEVATAENLYRQLSRERLTPEKVYWAQDEDGTNLPTELAALKNSQPAAAENAEIISLTPNKVAITATLQQEGLLVLTDTPFPGWKATVDGEKATLYSINGGLHRAVLLKGGRHQVIFSYWPQKLTYGLIVSLLTLLAVGAYLLVALQARRKKESAT